MVITFINKSVTNRLNFKLIINFSINSFFELFILNRYRFLPKIKWNSSNIKFWSTAIMLTTKQNNIRVHLTRISSTNVTWTVIETVFFSSFFSDIFWCQKQFKCIPITNLISKSYSTSWYKHFLYLTYNVLNSFLEVSIV